MYAEMLFLTLSCLTSSSASALVGEALICTVKSAPCAPASPNKVRASANEKSDRCRSLILRKTSVLGLRGTVQAYGVGNYARNRGKDQNGGSVAGHVLPRLAARQIARPKSTINEGQSAILPRKSGPGEIFEKKDCRK